MTNVGNLQVGVTVDAQNAEAMFAKLAAEAKAWGQQTARAAQMAEDALQETATQMTQTGNAAAGLNRVQRNQMGLASNLTAQYFDLATTIQMMQNPLTIGIQQGSQMAQVFTAASAATGKTGFAGAVDVLKGSLTQLLNPMNLLIVVGTTLLAAGVQYFLKTEEEAEDANEAVKKHAELLKDINELWPKLTEGLNNYVDSAPGIALAEATKEATDNLQGFETEVGNLATHLKQQTGEFELGGFDKSIFSAQIRDLQDQIRAGVVPDMKAWEDSVLQVANAWGTLDTRQAAFFTKQAHDVVAAGQKVVDLTGELGEAGDAMRDFYASAQTPEDLDLLIDRLTAIALAAETPAMKQAALDALEYAKAAKQAAANSKEAAEMQIEIERRTKFGAAGLRDMARAWGEVAQAQNEVFDVIDQIKDIEVTSQGASREVEQMWLKFTERDDLKTDDIIAVATAVKEVQDAIAATQEQGPILPEGWMNTEEILAQHSALMSQISTMWDQPAQGITEYGITMRHVLIDQAQQNFTTMETLANQSAVRLADSFRAALATLPAGEEFAPMKAAMEDFIASVEKGEPDVLALVNALMQMKGADPSPELNTMINAMIQAAMEALNLAGAAQQAGAAAAGSAGGYAEAAAALLNLAAAYRTARAEAAAGIAAEDFIGTVGMPTKTDLERLDEAVSLKLQEADATGNLALRAKTLADAEAARGRIADREAEREARKAGRGGGGGGGKSTAAKAAEDTDKWIESMLNAADPMRQINADFAKLEELMAQGKVTAEEYAAIFDLLTERARKAGKTATESFDAAATFANIMDQWGQQVASSLADAIVEGENLEDVFKSLLKQLLKMIIQMMILEPLMKSMMSGFSTGGATPTIPLPMGVPATLGRGVNARAVSGFSGGGRNSQTGGVTNQMGGMTINLGTGSDGVLADNGRAMQFGKRVRDIIQIEMVRQSRPGGLLYSTR